MATPGGDRSRRWAVLCLIGLSVALLVSACSGKQEAAPEAGAPSSTATILPGGTEATPPTEPPSTVPDDVFTTTRAPKDIVGLGPACHPGDCRPGTAAEWPLAIYDWPMLSGNYGVLGLLEVKEPTPALSIPCTDGQNPCEFTPGLPTPTRRALVGGVLHSLDFERHSRRGDRSGSTPARSTSATALRPANRSLRPSCSAPILSSIPRIPPPIAAGSGDPGTSGATVSSGRG